MRRFEQLEQFDDLLARIVALRQQDATAQDIADRLNAESWKPPKRLAFNAPMIRRLLQRRGSEHGGRSGRATYPAPAKMKPPPGTR